MAASPKQPKEAIRVVVYDPSWPEIYAAERANVLAAAGSRVMALEHIGSTAVPGLPAKPVI